MPEVIWEYVESDGDGAGVRVRRTEAQILAEFYPHWAEQMRKVGKGDQISEQNCLDDWVVVNWAYKVEGS